MQPSPIGKTLRVLPPSLRGAFVAMMVMAILVLPEANTKAFGSARGGTPIAKSVPNPGPERSCLVYPSRVGRPQAGPNDPIPHLLPEAWRPGPTPIARLPAPGRRPLCVCTSKAVIYSIKAGRQQILSGNWLQICIQIEY